jgi:hypothetical protein
MASSDWTPEDETMAANNIKILLVEAERSSSKHNDSHNIQRMFGILKTKIHWYLRGEIRG